MVTFSFGTNPFLFRLPIPRGQRRGNANDTIKSLFNYVSCDPDENPKGEPIVYRRVKIPRIFYGFVGWAFNAL